MGSMMSVLNIDKNKILISSGSGGIYSVKGDAFIYKDIALSWISPDHDKLELKHFMAAILLAPRINLIIVGTGNKMERLKPEMILELQKRGIGVEFCSSLKAVSLYNLLLSERDGEGVALFVKGITTDRNVYDLNTNNQQSRVNEMERIRAKMAKPTPVAYKPK